MYQAPIVFVGRARQKSAVLGRQRLPQVAADAFALRLASTANLVRYAPSGVSRSSAAPR